MRSPFSQHRTLTLTQDTANHPNQQLRPEESAEGLAALPDRPLLSKIQPLLTLARPKFRAPPHLLTHITTR